MSETPVAIESVDLRDDGKVVRGKEGRLFLDNDTNEVMAQHTGDLKLSREQVEQWRLLLEHRAAWVGRLGAGYWFLVAPDAHAVYPELLPDESPAAPERTVHQIMRGLRDADSYARFVYPLEEIARDKQRPVFAKTASHWSELGAFHGYRRLAEEIREKVPVPVLELDELDWSEEVQKGGLGHKLDPPESSVFVYLDVREPRSKLVFDNRIRNNGRRVEYEGDPANDFTCLVLGDSYAARVLPFLAESFGRLVFAHISTLDHRLVERERPDVVVSVMSERFLIHPPVDIPSPSLEDHEAAKRAAGALLPPRTVETNRLNAMR